VPIMEGSLLRMRRNRARDLIWSDASRSSCVRTLTRNPLGF
jgi:hypothetical protein